MKCKFANTALSSRATCDKKVADVCPYQYWCTNERRFRPSSNSKKCKYYEEAENSEQLNKE